MPEPLLPQSDKEAIHERALFLVNKGLKLKDACKKLQKKQERHMEQFQKSTRDKVATLTRTMDVVNSPKSKRTSSYQLLWYTVCYIYH